MSVTKPSPLLFGPYQPPALKKGDRAFCLSRNCVVVISDWTVAPIPWPLARRVDPPGGRGLLVDAELARAVRSESALAIRHWWGVTGKPVGCWRKVFGVGRMDSEGSRRLILGAIEATVAARYDSDQERNILWTPEEISLLGIHPDAEVAAQTGRTVNAVRLMREKLGRPNPEGEQPYLLWTEEDERLVLTLSAREAAERTGHTIQAVHQRRYKLRRRK